MMLVQTFALFSCIAASLARVDDQINMGQRGKFQMHSPGTFDVRSAGICFGPILDIHHASLEPMVSTPPEPKPFVWGTVRPHDVPKCVPAQSGSWRTYPLTSLRAPYDVTGWFAAHESVDPRPELDKLLRVAGSPSEYEPGNVHNNAETRNASVLLANNFHWMPPEDDVTREFPDAWATREPWNGTNAGNQGDSAGFWYNIGLVDYAHAAEQTQLWSRSPPHQRQSSAHGVWMHAAWSEYMWARIGFDDDYKQARSFLYFQGNTDFFATTFPGDAEPLRKWETELQRYERGVREGKTYSGLKEFNELVPQHVADGRRIGMRPIPSEDELLGPYPKDAHIFTVDELEYITHRNHQDEDFVPPVSLIGGEGRNEYKEQSRLAVFSPHLRDDIADLINEMVLAFIDRIMPCLGHSPKDCLEEMLPRAGVDNSVDRRIYEGLLMTNVNLPYFQAPLTKVKSFTSDKREDDDIDLDKVGTALLHIAVYLVEDMVFESDYKALGRFEARPDGERPIIVPESIRRAILDEWELAYHVFHSRLFWHGRPDDK